MNDSENLTSRCLDKVGEYMDCFQASRDRRNWSEWSVMYAFLFVRLIIMLSYVCLVN